LRTQSATRQPARLVIADACSLLDIIRSAERHTKMAGEAVAADTVRIAVEAEPDSLRVGVSDVARAEFEAHVDAIVEETRAALRSLRLRLTHADAVAVRLGLGVLLADQSEWENAIVGRVRDLALTLLGDSLRVDASDEDRNNAFRRTVDRRAPARQGAAATHDCVIAEGAMRLSRSREKSTTFLLTSNAKDFGGGGNRLDPNLEAEFAEAGLIYATTWSEVVGRLGI
jgi:hypothetical protein